MTANPKQSREYLAQRRAAAVEMRRAGSSLEHIADRLGYINADAARRDINPVLADVLRSPTEEARALDLLRIDGMIVSFWPDAKQGKPQAADRIMKLIELRAKLLGTFAPIQVEQVTMDAVEAEIKRLESELGTAARKAVRNSRAKGATGGNTRQEGGAGS